MITCPNCGAANRDQSSVCRMCATPLKTAAPITSPEKIEQEATNIVQDIACPRCQAMNEAFPAATRACRAGAQGEAR
jgi:hypothetical protein